MVELCLRNASKKVLILVLQRCRNIQKDVDYYVLTSIQQQEHPVIAGYNLVVNYLELLSHVMYTVWRSEGINDMKCKRRQTLYCYALCKEESEYSENALLGDFVIV